MIAAPLTQSAIDILSNPFGAAQTIDLFFVTKAIVLILAVLYGIFAVRVWVQVRRLERWLSLLQGYRFRTWALTHLVLAVVGILLVLVLL